MESGVESVNYFTTLLELPANQAMELLTDGSVKPDPVGPVFPSDSALVLRAAKYSVFGTEDFTDAAEKEEVENSVKVEPVELDSGSGSGLGSGAVSEDPNGGSESSKGVLKRKDREKKGKSCNKKSKTAPVLEDGEKLPYVHVRARRGQATDSHSLAERARREKINARMKLLQELVPGCNKISGTSLVLEEIINHVQYLQRQVEYLSMRLAAVHPRIDFNLDSMVSAGTRKQCNFRQFYYGSPGNNLCAHNRGKAAASAPTSPWAEVYALWYGAESMEDCNFPNMPMPFMWPEIQMNGDRQLLQQPQWHFDPVSQPVWVKEENHQSLVASENSLLSYDSPANSASLHSSQLKMEL